MSGLWVFVCGPSGAGKDSVLGWAAQELAAREDIVFARRLVTRAAHPGSDHDEVTPEQFARLMDCGGLAWRWQAHGFHYGIEARYAALVAAGRVVVVNGSREHVNTLQASEQLRVVQIEVDAAQLAARLAQRSRDTPQEVAKRLARNALFTDLYADCTIVNQSELTNAGRQLVDYLVGGALLPL
ncbi:MAG: phosphonate metabolism protein/1,5-bisphosphokinase (PRPP-forming) PhnN [Rhodoferax sp.]|uniref:phosphonate metabolism protein/1,5-bisphosphokinase (PRPP-forming) PhnN n=1 Tax=Rhodoferax sp. TaxID=50421 RepID=UPI0026078DB6|nr:phosphonate metabolism protein/1,5-bisphosphokinase (PRPP-forming) PhnN [Rhodoferax sp.]MDD2880804.1 phosphonate metabolism protein/1,5-bisphosphokinase (PRPP-forming) PhnN [Rhodoferax sp.]